MSGHFSPDLRRHELEDFIIQQNEMRVSALQRYFDSIKSTPTSLEIGDPDPDLAQPSEKRSQKRKLKKQKGTSQSDEILGRKTEKNLKSKKKRRSLSAHNAFESAAEGLTLSNSLKRKSRSTDIKLHNDDVDFAHGSSSPLRMSRSNNAHDVRSKSNDAKKADSSSPMRTSRSNNGHNVRSRSNDAKKTDSSSPLHTSRSKNAQDVKSRSNGTKKKHDQNSAADFTYGSTALRIPKSSNVQKVKSRSNERKTTLDENSADQGVPADFGNDSPFRDSRSNNTQDAESRLNERKRKHDKSPDRDIPNDFGNGSLPLHTPKSTSKNADKKAGGKTVHQDTDIGNSLSCRPKAADIDTGSESSSSETQRAKKPSKSLKRLAKKPVKHSKKKAQKTDLNLTRRSFTSRGETPAVDKALRIINEPAEDDIPQNIVDLLTKEFDIVGAFISKVGAKSKGGLSENDVRSILDNCDKIRLGKLRNTESVKKRISEYITKCTSDNVCSKNFWDKIQTDVNFKPPDSCPTRLLATKTQYREYETLVRSIEEKQHRLAEMKVIFEKLHKLRRLTDNAKLAGQQAALASKSAAERSAFTKAAQGLMTNSLSLVETFSMQLNAVYRA